jgi:hypothetical protein
MGIPMDNHHELCHGDDCGTWGCYELPENVGQHRRGEVISTNEHGVLIEWEDGTQSSLPIRRASKPAHQHAAWQIQDGPNGRFCAACGARVEA